MKRCFLCILLCLLLAGCGADPKQATKEAVHAFTFTDDLGRKVSVDKPGRVAALIGSFADIWCLAGGQETLIATAHDAWTSFELDLQNVTDLGAIKEPNLERLLSAEPDFILASCNTAANLELQEPFEQIGIPVAYFDIQTFEDYLRMLEICTELTGKPENYEENGTKVQLQVEAAIEKQNGSEPSVLCLRVTGSSCKAKGSQENVLGEMLADLGCRNIADQEQALLENLSLEAIIQADPDYIFAVLQGANSSGAQAVLEQTLLSNPAWKNLRAVKEGRFYTLDHRLYNLKPNARWGEAYEALADILYNET